MNDGVTQLLWRFSGFQ